MLDFFSIYIAQFCLTSQFKVRNSAIPRLMDPWGDSEYIYFLLNSYQATFINDTHPQGQVDMEVELVI